MSAEVISIFRVAMALAALILRGQKATDSAIGELRRDVGDLRERMVRLQGLFEGFTKREVAAGSQ